jgi:hypothetical protein
MECFKLGVLGCDAIGLDISVFWELVDGLSWYFSKKCLISAECYTFKPLNLHMLCS